MPARKASRVFVSYDYDNDLDLKNLLVGQARHRDTPFFVEDWSVKYASRGWRSDARSRISRASQVIVICGHHANHAIGVGAEVEIARETGTLYYLATGSQERLRTPSAGNLVLGEGISVDLGEPARGHNWTCVTLARR